MYSIEYLVDRKLYNRIVSMFSLTGQPKPWLIVSGDDPGRWADLSIRDFYGLIKESESMTELRTVALVMWVYGFDCPEMMVRMLRMMDEGQTIDALFCAAVMSSPRCSEEVRELLQENFRECRQEGLLEYVIGIDALDGGIDGFECECLAGLCSELVREKGVGVRDGFSVLCRLAMFYDEKGDSTSSLCKSLFSLWTSVPKENSKAVSVCRLYGMDFRDCLLFSVLMQDYEHAKMVKRSSKKMRSLMEAFVRVESAWLFPWEDVDRRAVVRALKGYQAREAGLRIANDENFYWLLAETGMGEGVLLSFNSRSRRERYAKLSDGVRRSVMRNSLAAATDVTLRALWCSDEGAIREAFEEFSEHSVGVFSRLVQLGLWSEVQATDGEMLYLAEYLKGWGSHRSYDFMEFALERYGIRSECMRRLLSGVSTVDHGFLDSGERERLFSVANDCVFFFRPGEYKRFVEMNVAFSPTAACIWEDAMGGEGDE